jgi:hypothetical protein
VKILKKIGYLQGKNIYKDTGLEITNTLPCSREAAILLEKELIDIVVYKYDTGEGVLVLLDKDICQPALMIFLGTIL